MSLLGLPLTCQICSEKVIYFIILGLKSYRPTSSFTFFSFHSTSPRSFSLFFFFFIDTLLYTMTTEEVTNIVVHPVPSRLLDPKQCPTPHISSMEQYRSMWKESVEDSDKFFGNVNKNLYCFLLC